MSIDIQTGRSKRDIFETLDGVRGFAALAVVIFHAPTFFAPFSLPSAYLAVDLFFALSGFVIDFAYRTRLDGGLGAVAFMRLRIIRLYPLYLLGTLIGVLSAVAALALGGGLLSPMGLVGATLANLLILPSPAIHDAPHLFPLNSPGWSLFFELVINLIFVAIWRRLTRRTALAIALCGGITLMGLSLACGNMGLGDTWPTFAFGFLRATTSFFAGVALHRLYSARHVQPRAGAAAAFLPLALLPLFAVALTGGWKMAFDFIFIGVATPLCIWTCARAVPGTTLGPIFRFLGKVSYAVYVLHYPLVELVRRVLHILHGEPQALAPFLGAAFLLALLAAAWAADELFDIRVRRFLTQRATGRVRTRSKLA